MFLVSDIKAGMDVLSLPEKVASGKPVTVEISGPIRIAAKVGDDLVTDVTVNVNEETTP